MPNKTGTVADRAEQYEISDNAGISTVKFLLCMEYVTYLTYIPIADSNTAAVLQVSSF